MRAVSFVAPALGLVVLSTAGSAVADCARPFADPNEILTFHVRVARKDWDTLRLAPTVGAGCLAEFPRVKGEFKCGDGADWMMVGLHRKRGDQRGRDTDQKPPLKIDFNFVVNGQSWPRGMGDLGYRKLSMNQGQHDEPGGVLPDLLSEYIADRILKREVPAAPAVSYARLYVTFVGEAQAPEYHGLYILLEDIDRSAIRRRYGIAQGGLFKTTQGACRDQEVFNDGDPNAAKTAYDDWNRKDPNGNYPGGWAAETEKAIDLDELLRQEAVRDILVNYDDTLLGANYSNFYRYDAKPGAPRHYFPWDCDDCFKGPYSVGTTNIAFDQALIHSSSPLGNKTRNHPAIRPRYYQIVCQLLNGGMASDKVVAEIDQVHNLIKNIVAEEAGPVWGGKNPLDETRPWYYGWEWKRMRDWYPRRVANARQQLAARGAACPAMCTAGQSEACRFLTCPGKRSCTAGSWTACAADPGCVVGAPPGDGGAGAPSADGGARDAGADVATVGDARGAGGAGSGGIPGGGGAGTAGSGGATGRGGASGSSGPGVAAGAGRAGGAPAAGAGGAGSVDDPGGVPDDAASGGCTCELQGYARRPSAPLWLGLAVALTAARRFRRAKLPGARAVTPPRDPAP